MEGLGLVTHFIAWLPFLSLALISPSVPVVCNKAGRSTAPIGRIMQLFFPRDSEASRHLIVTCIFGNLPTDAHQFGNSHLVKF